MSSRAETHTEESAYRAIFEASSDGLVINDAETGVVLEANPAFCRMHGYDHMVGLHPTVFIHPSSHHLFEAYVRAIRTGQEFRSRAQDVRRDGTIFDVEVVGRGFVYEGHFALLGVVRDMTEHVRAYQNLEARVAERTREIERRREVAEALSELLGVVNSRRALDDMLSAIVAQAARLLGSDAEALYLVDDSDPSLLRLQASRNIPPETEALTVAFGTPLIGLAAQRQRPVVTVDLPALVTTASVASVDDQIVDRGSYLEVAHTGPASANSVQRQHGNRVLAERFCSLVVVPLMARGTAHGALMLAYRLRHVPADDELELIAAFAGQAGLAIESARLHARSEQRRHEMEVLYQADERLYQSLRLDDVLQALADEAAGLLHAERTSVLVWDDSRERLTVRAAHGFEPAVLARMSFGAGEGISAQVATTGVPITVHDVLEDPRIPPHINQTINRDASIRSLVSVPIKLEGEVFGVFNLNSATPRSLVTDEQKLIDALAQRAAMAIRNARLHEESEERRQELEAFYQADQELHGSLRLEHVLDVLVDLPMAIGRAEIVSLLLWNDEEERFVVGGVRGMSGAVLNETFTMTDLHIARRTPGAIVEIEDAATDTRVSERLRRTTTREGVRAWISCPIRTDGRLFGIFSFGFWHPHVFTSRERRLLTALAQRAALAIQNARLHEESERQRRELEALYEADEALHRSLRLQDVLNALVDAAVHLLQVDIASLWGPDRWPAGRMAPLASHGLSAEYLRESVLLNEEPGIVEFWQEHDSLVIEDVLNDSSLPASQCALLGREGYRALLMTQIRIGASPFGSFTVGRRTPHRFSAQEQRLLTALAQRAGLAIQNAHLYEQAQQAATLEERQRLARELHDAVTQTLFSTALIAEVIPELWDVDPDDARKRLADLRRLTRGALAEMRTLLVELRPDALTQIALGDLLGQLAEATAGRTGLEVKVRIDGAVRRLPPPVHIALYRVAQEALNNVVRHAQARHAVLQLVFADEQVRLRVTDDGRGFVSGPAAPAGHFGLGIMRERAESIGAQLQLVGQPREGTLVEMTWRDPADRGVNSPFTQVQTSSPSGRIARELAE
jgi:PAS domain S-box-containing protein